MLNKYESKPVSCSPCFQAWKHLSSKVCEVMEELRAVQVCMENFLFVFPLPRILSLCVCVSFLVCLLWVVNGACFLFVFVLAFVCACFVSSCVCVCVIVCVCVHA